LTEVIDVNINHGGDKTKVKGNTTQAEKVWGGNIGFAI
jgi:hypothetical protein